MLVIRLDYNKLSHISFTFLAEGKCDPPKQNTFLCRTAFSIWNAILFTSSKLDFNFALYIWNNRCKNTINTKLFILTKAIIIIRNLRHLLLAFLNVMFVESVHGILAALARPFHFCDDFLIPGVGKSPKS